MKNNDNLEKHKTSLENILKKIEAKKAEIETKTNELKELQNKANAIIGKVTTSVLDPTPLTFFDFIDMVISHQNKTEAVPLDVENNSAQIEQDLVSEPKALTEAVEMEQ